MQLDIYLQSFLIFSHKVSLKFIDVLDIVLIPLSRPTWRNLRTLINCKRSFIHLNQPFLQLFPTFTVFNKKWARAKVCRGETTERIFYCLNFAPNVENFKLGSFQKLFCTFCHFLTTYEVRTLFCTFTVVKVNLF